MDHLVITTLCNDNCISCVNSINNRKAVHALAKFKEIEDKIRAHKHISIGGGEPTLHPEFFDFLEFVDRMGKEYTLLTNARAFSDDAFFKKFDSLELDSHRLRVATTIYGYDAKTHDSVSRAPGGFEQKIKAIRKFIDNGYRVELRIVVSKLNFKWLEMIAKYISENLRGIERVAIVSAKMTGEAEKNKRQVLVPIKETTGRVVSAIDILVENGFVTHLLHYPHCVLPEKYWRYTRGVTAEDSEIVFLEVCDGCAAREECCGVWKSYVALEGEKEFEQIGEQDTSYTKKKARKFIINYMKAIKIDDDRILDFFLKTPENFLSKNFEFCMDIEKEMDDIYFVCYYNDKESLSYRFDRFNTRAKKLFSLSSDDADKIRNLMLSLNPQSGICTFSYNRKGENAFSNYLSFQDKSLIEKEKACSLFLNHFGSNIHDLYKKFIPFFAGVKIGHLNKNVYGEIYFRISPKSLDSWSSIMEKSGFVIEKINELKKILNKHTTPLGIVLSCPIVDKQIILDKISFEVSNFFIDKKFKNFLYDLDMESNLGKYIFFLEARYISIRNDPKILVYLNPKF